VRVKQAETAVRRFSLWQGILQGVFKIALRKGHLHAVSCIGCSGFQQIPCASRAGKNGPQEGIFFAGDREVSGLAGLGVHPGP
jgi:hypothetical protein